MVINRNNIFNKFKWLKDKNRPFIISADYDGLACAAFLSHYMKWKLTGYYNMEKIWISKYGIENKKELIWVDLNILPKSGKSIGGPIGMIDNTNPSGLNSSCNLNTLRKLTHENFNQKFPFSTLIFLMWLFKITIKNNTMSKLLILHSDSSWMKIQKYSRNVQQWIELLGNYDWNHLIKNVDDINFEKFIDQTFYPTLINLDASTGFSKLKSKHLGIKSRECRFNPDWDEYVILNLFELFKQHLSSSTQELPVITHRINGEKFIISLDEILKVGLKKFISDNKIFSSAVTSPKKIKYTIFNPLK